MRNYYRIYNNTKNYAEKRADETAQAISFRLSSINDLPAAVLCITINAVLTFLEPRKHPRIKHEPIYT